jgi:hypothetical protein
MEFIPFGLFYSKIVVPDGLDPLFFLYSRFNGIVRNQIVNRLLDGYLELDVPQTTKATHCRLEVCQEEARPTGARNVVVLS